MGLNFDNFMKSLPYMGEGMLCIFIVIGLIILSVYALNAISARASKAKKDDN